MITAVPKQPMSRCVGEPLKRWNHGWRLFICLPFVLFGAACGIDQKGMVLLVDPTYRATVFSSYRNGITMPDGLWWHNGQLFMADEGGRALRVWSAAGIKTLSDASVGLQSPDDLVMDNDGNLFFTDDEAGGVWQRDTTGKTFQLAGREKGLISTAAIAIAPTGEILAGDGMRHQVFSVSRNGEVSVFLGTGYGINKPESMVFDESGNLYIADNQDQIVYMVTPELKLQRLLEKHLGFSPETLWYAKNTLFITDSAAGKLYRYAPESGLQTIAVFGGKLAAVNGITMDEQGSIYLSIQTDLKRKMGYLIKLEREAKS